MAGAAAVVVPVRILALLRQRVAAALDFCHLSQESDRPALRRENIRFNADKRSYGASKRRRDDEEDGGDDEDDEDGNGKGRRKIEIKYIADKSKRHITFSKRKAGIMKKAYELSTLTGTQVLLLVVSETGLVYTFTTNKLQPLVVDGPGKALIARCLGTDGDPEGQQEDDDLDEEEHEHGEPVPSRPSPTDEDIVSPTSAPPPRLELPDPHQGDIYPHHLEPPHHPQMQHHDPYPPQSHPQHLQISVYGEHPPLPGAHPSLPGSFDPAAQYAFDPSALGMHGMAPPSAYPGISAQIPVPSSYASLPPLPGSLTAASYVNAVGRNGYAAERTIKRRRTEGDLRSRSRSTEPAPRIPCAAPDLPTHNGRTTPPPDPGTYRLAHETYHERRQFYSNHLAATATAFREAPSLLNAMFVFAARDLAEDVPLSLPGDPTDSEPPISRFMTLLREGLSRYPRGQGSVGGDQGQDGEEWDGSWAEEAPMDRNKVQRWMDFFAEQITPEIDFKGRVGADMCETLMEFLSFVASSMGFPPFDTSVISNAKTYFIQSELMEGRAGDSNRPRGAPKVKPRKALNPAIRGPRIAKLLMEYGNWNLKNKNAATGNRRGTRIAAVFRLERVRRTFCVCEASDFECPTPARENASFFKIRFPPSALKIIRRGDKLRLHIRCADDGSEWNIVAYDGAELGDKPEEDEDDAWSEATEYKKAISEGLSDEQARVKVLRRRGLKEMLDSGELPDDGFESVVPPKGGKPSFRVKQGAPGKPLTPTEEEDYD